LDFDFLTVPAVYLCFFRKVGTVSLSSTFLVTILQTLESYRIFRFIIAGGFASAVYYVIAISLDALQIIPVMVCNTLAYMCGMGASYTSQKYWTFKDSSPHARALPRFLASSLSGMALNSLIVWLLLRAEVPYYIASFITVILVAFFFYFVQRFFVFTQSE